MTEIAKILRSLFPNLNDDQIANRLLDPQFQYLLSSDYKLMVRPDITNIPFRIQADFRKGTISPGFAIARFYGDTANVDKFARSLHLINASYKNLAKVHFLVDELRDYSRTAYIRKNRAEIEYFVSNFQIDQRYELSIDSLSFSSRGKADIFGFGEILAPCVEGIKDAVKFLVFKKQILREQDANARKAEAAADKAEQEARRLKLQNDFYERETKHRSKHRRSVELNLSQAFSIPETDLEEIMEVVDAQIIESQSNLAELIEEDVFNGAEIIDFSPPDLF